MTATSSRKADATRRKIVDTALQLFVAKGIAETTIRDIATHAAIAEGTMYRHFPSKDALAYDLFADNLTGFAHTLETLQAAKNTREEKLAAMIAGFCALFDENRALFSFLLLAQHQEMQKLPPDAANPVDVVHRVVAETDTVGSPDAELKTAMVLGVVLQTATFLIYNRLTGTMSARADQLTAAALRVLAQDQISSVLA